MIRPSSLVILPQGREVRKASEWLSSNGEIHGVPSDQVGRLDLCLNEALANVIEHGAADSPDPRIELLFELIDDQDKLEARVTLSDSGPAFDTVSAPLAERPKCLEDAEPGGLGLMMIRSFSDTLRYDRVNDRNELRFGVRWDRA